MKQEKRLNLFDIPDFSFYQIVFIKIMHFMIDFDSQDKKDEKV
jgi:hypothetical protein